MRYVKSVIAFCKFGKNKKQESKKRGAGDFEKYSKIVENLRKENPSVYLAIRVAYGCSSDLN